MATRDSDVVSLLVSRGADVNARSKRGETPLADAAARERLVVLLARLLSDETT